MRYRNSIPAWLSLIAVLTTISACYGENHIPGPSGPDAASAAAPSIHWEVLNRFRVMDDDRDFYASLSQYLPLAKRTLPFGIPIDPLSKSGNYKTLWVSSQGAYDQNRLHDPVRIVRLWVDGTPDNSTCLWQIDARPPFNGSCGDTRITSDTASHQVQVRFNAIRRADPILITIEDIWIVGLGDSYASGEGNPHIDFKPGRRSTSRGKIVAGAPALWWDSRCHRSLLSGQALAAAQIALRSPHASVTFLSFACSGATIDQGILTSWHGTEKRKQVLDDYTHFGWNVGTSLTDTDIPVDQYPMLGDIPSQLKQMQSALIPPGQDTARRPDYIWISV